MDRCDAMTVFLEAVQTGSLSAAGEYNEPRGDLVITAPIVFGRLHVLPLIAEFLAAFPQINARLMPGDRIVNLLEDHVDLAVRVGPAGAIHSHTSTGIPGSSV